jgi:carboxyl-terminal processing protease
MSHVTRALLILAFVSTSIFEFVLGFSHPQRFLRPSIYRTCHINQYESTLPLYMSLNEEEPIVPEKDSGTTGSSSFKDIYRGKLDTHSDIVVSRSDGLETETQPSPFLRFWKSLSFPNILAGSFIGAIGTLAALFIPFFIDYDSSTSSSTKPSSSQSITASSVEKIQEKASMFGDILYDLDTGYVDEIDQNRLFETAVTAMLRSLDPYTEYENVMAAQSMQESVSGKYGGVGLVITSAKDSIPKPADQSNAGSRGLGVEVADAFEGYAYDAGLRVGDRIVSINGVDTREMTIEQVRNLLRGDPDTNVNIRFERQVFAKNRADVSASPKFTASEVSLKRSLVRVSDVRLASLIGDPQEGVGYISLSGFNAAVAKDFRTAMLMLRYSAPNDLKGLILDLRGNPGGLLDAAVEIASYLVPAKSDIVSSKSKDGVEIIYRSSIDPIRPPGMKLVVLVNGNSASASEVVSGAIQDLDAGLIVGSSKTYGKGLVQKVRALSDDAALKYTVARYYTPSGRCIQAVKYNGGRASPKIASLSKTGFDSMPITSSPEPSSLSSAGEDVLSDGAELIEDSDRKTFQTLSGRPVKDGGGIEPDVLIPATRPGPAETTFITQGIFADFAEHYLQSNDIRGSIRDAVLKERKARLNDPRVAGVMNINSMMQYLVLDSPDSPVHFLRSSSHFWDLLNSRNVMRSNQAMITDEKLFVSFKHYVEDLIRENKIRVDSSSSLAVGRQIESLERSLKAEGFDAAVDEVEMLKTRLIGSIIADMDRHKDDIVNDIELAILSREFPNRLLFYRNLQHDPQVIEAVKVLQTATFPRLDL